MENHFCIGGKSCGLRGTFVVLQGTVFVIRGKFVHCGKTFYYGGELVDCVEFPLYCREKFLHYGEQFLYYEEEFVDCGDHPLYYREQFLYYVRRPCLG